jgi:hypothetical protein
LRLQARAGVIVNRSLNVPALGPKLLISFSYQVLATHMLLEKQGKVIDNEYKMALEKLKIEADLAKAEITTKAQRIEERLKFVEHAWLQIHGQAHEHAIQANEHEHQAGLTQRQQDAETIRGSG